jgi:hypothetical protein
MIYHVRLEPPDLTVWGWRCRVYNLLICKVYMNYWLLTSRSADTGLPNGAYQSLKSIEIKFRKFRK